MERPFGMGGFQFVELASLRAVQLTRGCRPRVDGDHKLTVIAQLEVSQGKVDQIIATDQPHDVDAPHTDVPAANELTPLVQAV